MFVKPLEHPANTARRERDARIRRTLIQPDGVAIGGNGAAAREDDVVHIAVNLVWFFWSKKPLVAAF